VQDAAQAMLQKQSKFYLDLAITQMADAIPCPGVDCKNFAFGKVANVPQCVTCSSCQTGV